MQPFARMVGCSIFPHIYIERKRLLEFFLNKVLMMFSRAEKQFAAYSYPEVLPV